MKMEMILVVRGVGDASIMAGGSADLSISETDVKPEGITTFIFRNSLAVGDRLKVTIEIPEE